jgi:uncharacterized protein YcfJ
MKNRKIRLVLSSVALLSIGTAALAQGYDSDGSFSDRARVTRVSPTVERVSIPHDECRTMTEYSRQVSDSSDNTGGTIVGGIVGGLLGSQIGGGNGKVAAAAAGAIGGAMVGGHLSSGAGDEPHIREGREVRRCRQVTRYEERTTGYDVSYQYQGRTFRTHTRRDPGEYIQLSVQISPSDD